MGDPVRVASCFSHSVQLYLCFLPGIAPLLIPNTQSAKVFSQKSKTDESVCVPAEDASKGPKTSGGW